MINSNLIRLTKDFATKDKKETYIIMKVVSKLARGIIDTNITQYMKDILFGLSKQELYELRGYLNIIYRNK